MAAAQAGEDGATHELFFARTASAQVLDTQRGRADQQLNLMLVEGTLYDNNAINTISGDNIITNGAFSNANGLATAIQNSGNNVLIQNATILTIELR